MKTVASTGLRRVAPLAPLFLFIVLLVLVMADGPTPLRLALCLIGTTIGAGTPIVGLLGLPRSPARASLVVGASLTVGVLVSEALVLIGRLTPTAGAAGMALATAPFSLARFVKPEPLDERDHARLRIVAELRRLPRWPAVLTAGSVVLWAVAASVVDPRAAGDTGMITALPLVWWTGLAALTVAFAGHMRRGRANVVLAVVQVAALIAFLYATMTVAQPFSRIPTSYTHVGLVDYVARDQRIASSFDARYSWPGAISLGAMITQLAGLSSSIALVKWAIPTFVALWSLAVYAVATAFAGADARRWIHPRRRPLPWIAVWIFLALNWVGQDYWSSQALNFFLVLVVIAAVTAWFPRRAPSARTPGLLPREPSASVGAATRAGLFVTLAAIASAIASSHQLSPFMLTGALVVLWLVDRRDIRLLPLLVGLLTIVWISWGAQSYWVSHLGDLTQNVGEVGEVVTAGTSARIASGTEARQTVLLTRLALSLAAWAAAALVFVALRRHRRDAATVAGLVLVPFGAVGMQEYGGELGLRIFLFSLPFVALLLAHPTARGLTGRWRRPAIGLGAAGVAVSLITLGFVTARYGNEQFEQVYVEDVAAVREFYRVAPLDSHVIANNTSNPFRFGPYHDYRPAEFEGVSHPDTDLEASLRAAGIGQGYVLVFESGIKEAILRDGSPVGWERTLDRRLDALGAREIYRARRAALYEFELDGVAPLPRPDPPERTLASRFVRALLGVPALEAASAVVLFVLVFGALHVGGLRPRRGWPDVASWIGAAGVTAIVLARFVAFT